MVSIALTSILIPAAQLIDKILTYFLTQPASAASSAVISTNVLSTKVLAAHFWQLTSTPPAMGAGCREGGFKQNWPITKPGQAESKQIINIQYWQAGAYCKHPDCNDSAL